MIKVVRVCLGAGEQGCGETGSGLKQEEERRWRVKRRV